MADTDGDDLRFYHALQRCIRAEAGKTLTPLLKRWRYTQSADAADAPLTPDALRFLARFGTLDSGDEPAASTARFHALLTKTARASGDAPGVVAAWIELFSAGSYGVTEAVCAVQPRCAICPLKERCRYLAAGAKDTRSFGQSLADDLLTAPDDRSADVRPSELLAFVMAGEKSGAADIARAEAALKELDGLRGVFGASPEALKELKISDPAVARIQAAAELSRLWAGEKVKRGRSFGAGKDFFEHYHLRLRDLKKEVFIVVMLDQKHALIGEEQVSEGSLTETLVHPREVFAQAIARRAAAVALVHNHPSGDPAPSAADRSLTKRLAGVAQLVGIRLLDHVIVGDGRYLSFQEEGLLA